MAFTVSKELEISLNGKKIELLSDIKDLEIDLSYCKVEKNNIKDEEQIVIFTGLDECKVKGDWDRGFVLSAYTEGNKVTNLQYVGGDMKLTRKEALEMFGEPSEVDEDVYGYDMLLWEREDKVLCISFNKDGKHIIESMRIGVNKQLIKNRVKSLRIRRLWIEDLRDRKAIEIGACENIETGAFNINGLYIRLGISSIEKILRNIDLKCRRRENKKDGVYYEITLYEKDTNKLKVYEDAGIIVGLQVLYNDGPFDMISTIYTDDVYENSEPFDLFDTLGKPIEIKIDKKKQLVTYKFVHDGLEIEAVFEDKNYVYRIVSFGYKLKA